LSACILAAPAPWVWALADNIIDPNTNAAADKVSVSFLIDPPSPSMAKLTAERALAVRRQLTATDTVPRHREDESRR
jgi:hypothetical protein